MESLTEHSGCDALITTSDPSNSSTTKGMSKQMDPLKAEMELVFDFSLREIVYQGDDLMASSINTSLVMSPLLGRARRDGGREMVVKGLVIINTWEWSCDHSRR
jgi:hypothetical protein